MSQQTPEAEYKRLRALYAYNILDSDPEKGFDELTELAAELCDVPAALVSLIDRDRQWFKSLHGMDGTETPLDESFCVRAVRHRIPLLEVPDALEDEEFRHFDAVTKDGVRFYAGALIESSEGEPLGTLCVIDYQPRELTDQQRRVLRVLSRQVQSQMELRRANLGSSAQASHLQRLVDQLPVMICELDQQCRFTFSNTLFRQWWGFSEECINGWALGDVLADQALCQEKAQLIQRCTTEGTIEREEVSEEGRIRTVSYTPLVPGDPNSEVLIVGRDITEERRIETMKNEFVSTVSHELRTPLTSIIGALGLVTGGALGELSEQAQSMLSIAHENSQRLRYLINDLLDMDKLVAGQMVFEMKTQPLDVLVEKAVAEIASYAQPYNVTVVPELAEQPLHACVDDMRFLQILVNLLSNAVKFSPAGSEVRIQLQEHAGNARVAVVDEGPGISLEAQKRLFDRFYQVDASSTRNKGGTGLGLAISKKLAERMNGHLFVQTAAGEGAAFILDLPLAAEEADNEALGDVLHNAKPLVMGTAGPDEGRELVARMAESGTWQQKLRVLHVEDDEDLQQVLSTVAQDLAHFDGVQTLAEARQILRERSYDLIILDVDLPDGYGWSLLDELRASPRKPSVVVLSGLDEPPPEGVHVDERLTKSRVSDEEFRQMLIRYIQSGPNGPAMGGAEG